MRQFCLDQALRVCLVSAHESERQIDDRQYCARRPLLQAVNDIPYKCLPWSVFHCVNDGPIMSRCRDARKDPLGRPREMAKDDALRKRIENVVRKAPDVRASGLGIGRGRVQ